MNQKLTPKFGNVSVAVNYQKIECKGVYTAFGNNSQNLHNNNHYPTEIVESGTNRLRDNLDDGSRQILAKRGC